MKINYFITLLLVLAITGPFLVSTLPFYELNVYSTMVLALEVAILLLCLTYMVFNPSEISFPKQTKIFLALFSLYYLFVFYQILISPYLPRESLTAVPSTNLSLFRTFFVQAGELVVFLALYKKIDLMLFAKVTIFMTAILFFAYFNKVNFLIYGLENVDDINLYEGNERIGSFDLAAFMAFAFFCNLAIRQSWNKSKTISYSIFIAFAVLFGVGVILTVKRGPIVSFLFVLLVWFIREKQKTTVFALIIMGALLIFGGSYFSSISDNSSGLVQRFADIGSDGGSGRFGDSQSVYRLAWNQIVESPVLGSYFRLLHGNSKGTYPHNIILELIMTFGIFFTGIFLFMLWKVLRKCYRILRLEDDRSIAVLCFFYILTCMMFSYSLFLKANFWVLLTMAYAVAFERKSKVMKVERQIIAQND